MLLKRMSTVQSRDVGWDVVILRGVVDASWHVAAILLRVWRRQLRRCLCFPMLSYAFLCFPMLFYTYGMGSESLQGPETMLFLCFSIHTGWDPNRCRVQKPCYS